MRMINYFGSDIFTHQLRGIASRFHRDENGQNTMEIMIILFIAVIALVFLTQAGNEIITKVGESIKSILTFKVEYNKITNNSIF
jgi:hypothetical protein